MPGSGTNRKIRVLNGARAILEIFRNLPFRCVFVGEMPIFLNGGRAPMGLDLILIPQPGIQSPSNIATFLCQHKSTKFKFSFDRNRLKYVDLSGKIPAGKQNWCSVETFLIQDPPPSQLDLGNVVEIGGIPTVCIFFLFIDTLEDLLDRYDSLRTHSQSWLTKGQIKKIRHVIEPISQKRIVPQNLDQACAALAVAKRFITVLSGPPPTPSQFQELAVILRKIAGKIGGWMNTRRRSVIIDDRGMPPVTQAVDNGPEPSSGAVEEDCDGRQDSVIGDSEVSPVTPAVFSGPERVVEDDDCDEIENWVNPNDDRGTSPVTHDQAVDNGAEPSSGAVEEDHCDESDDWVEVAGMVETHGTDSEYCGERVDDALDFVLLGID